MRSEEALEMLLEAQRVLRHDLLNHLQVISGYLQVNYHERAKEYCLEAHAFLHKYSLLGRVNLLYLQAYLTWLVSRFTPELKGLNIEVRGPIQSWQPYDKEVACILKEIMELLLPFLEKDRLQTKIVLGDKSGTQFKVIIEGEALESIRQGLSSLVEKLVSSRLQLSLQARNPLELVIAQACRK